MKTLDMNMEMKALDGEEWWKLRLGDTELIVMMIMMRSKKRRKRRRHRKDFPNLISL
jgi:hypothetical protein